MPQLTRAEDLDFYLQELVHALQRTVNYAMPHIDDEKKSEKALYECEKILRVVLEGRVEDWLA
jgi:hypothetical protein